MAITETTGINSEVILLLDKLSDKSRMPLSAIIGFSEILLKDDVHSKHKASIDLIRESGEYLMELIKDVADFAKLNSGQLKIEKQPANLEKIVATLASSFRDKACSKGLDFKIIQHSELPCQIHTDSNLLKRSLKNLIDNALKYTGDGHVHMKIALTDYKGQPGIKFRIEDTGCGMTAEQCDNILKEFNEINLSSLNKINCTGLGLPITHEIVNILGGAITFDSEKDKGSVFCIQVPLGLEIERQEMFLTYAHGASEACIEPMDEAKELLFFDDKVLIAEDNDINQLLLKTLLETFGLTVKVASDGEKAVEMAESEQFQLILMDVEMPNVNGIEAVRMIRDSGNETPIIAITAYATADYKEKCFEAGCNEYMTKPIDGKLLRDMLEKYLKPVNVSEHCYSG